MRALLSARRRRLLFYLAVGGGVLLVAPLLLVASGGNPVAGLAPALAVGLFYGLTRLPLRTSALGLLFLVLSTDYLFEMPFEGLWSSPTAPIARLLFLNLSTVTGVGALRLPLVDLAVFFLLLLHGWRRATGNPIDGPGRPTPRILNQLLLVSLGTVVWLEVWGLLNGGNFNESLWQLRQLLILPLVAFVFTAALRGDASDYRAIVRVCIAAALVKAFESIYFHFAIVRPGGHDPEFATSHSDTLNYVLVLMMGIGLVFEQPTRRNLGKVLLWAPWVTWGMLINDRRLAYVSLAMCLITLLVMSPWTRAKRGVLKTLVVLSPVLLLYTAAGWNSLSPVFGGAQLVKSIIYGDPSQAGADYRDIENYDLLGTWADKPLLGSGFGHKFLEPIKLPDISFVMPTYQYHPHNSILWLWGVGGIIGFTGLFLWAVAMVLLAARSYHRAHDPKDRVAAICVISMLLIHLNQCFGDMGTRSYFGSFLMGLAVAVASHLSVRVGAWPAPRALPVEEGTAALAGVPPTTA